MRLIEDAYLEHPFYGRRRLTHQVNTILEAAGQPAVNEKRVRRLMDVMCIEAIYPKKRLSQPGVDGVRHKYLLRDLSIDHPDQVWATDITWVRLKRGFLYATAVIDWHSRCILAWDISNTMETAFCISTVKSALSTGHTPEIFNSDQGSQYTSREFTGMLEDRGIRVSHDGRGRALDNVMIERFWRSLKYEEVFLHDYEDGREAAQMIGNYIRFYNTQRPHSSLGNRPPSEVYHRTS